MLKQVIWSGVEFIVALIVALVAIYLTATAVGYLLYRSVNP